MMALVDCKKRGGEERIEPQPRRKGSNRDSSWMHSDSSEQHLAPSPYIITEVMLEGAKSAAASQFFFCGFTTCGEKEERSSYLAQ